MTTKESQAQPTPREELNPAAFEPRGLTGRVGYPKAVI